MAETIGLVASVITVLESGRHLYEILEDIRDAKKSFHHLSTELSATNKLLESLVSALRIVQAESLTANQQGCLQDFDLAIHGLGQVYDELRRKVEDTTPNSTSDRVSKRDSMRLVAQKKNIQALTFRVSSHKLTIIIMTLTAFSVTGESPAKLDRKWTRSRAACVIISRQA